MMYLSILLCLATVLSPCLAEDKVSWKVAEFPDPITQPKACGRDQPSFICDPNNLLPKLKANMIDGMLKSIYNETSFLCYSIDPKAARRRGYLVMLAVLPKMDKYHTAKMNDTIYARYREGRFFSYHLGTAKKWGNHSLGCNEMVIILYSRDDGVLYTSTQQTARRLLTDSVVRVSLMSTLTRFYPFSATEDRAANGIQYLVNMFSKTLREDGADN